MERTATILNTAIQTCANLAIVFEPFLPFMSARLLKMLGGETISWEMLGCFDLVPAGAQLAQPELLFDKIEDAAVEAQLDRLARIKAENERIKAEQELKNWRPEPQQADVPFDTFEQVDMRVGTVIECERVKKSDKLLRFLIEIGRAHV